MILSQSAIGMIGSTLPMLRLGLNWEIFYIVYKCRGAARPVQNIYE